MAQQVIDPRPDLAYSRTHLANQRTYAAWLRTGLSIAAAAFAVEYFAKGVVEQSRMASLFGWGLIITGASLVIFGAWSFHRFAAALASAGTPVPSLAGWLVYTSACVMTLLILGAWLTI